VHDLLKIGNVAADPGAFSTAVSVGSHAGSFLPSTIPG
jgi:hypothetical protein